MGGAQSITSKVCLVGPADGTDEEADIRFRDIYRSKMLSLAMSQYQFRQVRVAKASVDDSHGDCGNMLAAVASFAVERGLVAVAAQEQT